jgi:carbon storage regulator
MLVVTLKEKEKVLVGNDISVMVVEIRGKQIRLAIQAPDDVLILREKLANKLANKEET